MKRLPFIFGFGILIFSIVNMKMGYLGNPEIDEIDFFVLLIALILIGIGIFIFREEKLKKRRIVQLSLLILLSLGLPLKMLYAPYLHCDACPLASTACPIGAIQNFIILGKVPYYLLGYTTLFFAVLGRSLCGWVCPFGILQDAVDKIFNRKKVMTHQFRFTKFIVLIVTLLAAWKFSDTLFCRICPAGFIEAAVPYRIEHGMIFDSLFIFRIFFFIFLMGIIFLISRFWCRYLCPLGAWAGIFNKISFLKLSFDSEKCTHCDKCLDVCPQGIDPTTSERSTDCTLCGECVEVCPNDALELTFPTAALKLGVPAKKVEKETVEEKEKIINETPLKTYEPLKVYKSKDEIGFYDLPADVKKLKITFYHLEEDIPPVLEGLKKFMKIEFLPVETSEFLEPTLMINNRVFAGKLTEKEIIEGLKEEIKMGKMLDIVFDLKKCKYCKRKQCGVKIIGETGFKIEKLIDYPDFSEIIAACTKNAVFLAYGEPKIEEYNRKYILSQRFSLDRMEAEIVIEKDSKYCNTALTIFSLLSYASNGVINFKPRDYTDIKSKIPFKIRSLPSIIAKGQRFYLTTERGLIKFLQKL